MVWAYLDNLFKGKDTFLNTTNKRSWKDKERAPCISS